MRCWTAAITIGTVCAAGAAAAQPEPTAAAAQAECAALGRQAVDGADDRPGVDARGNAVAPADLGGGAAQPNFTIDLTIDALQAARIDPRFAGVEGAASLGEIRIEGGRADLSGALLDPKRIDELRRLCRQQFER